MTKSADADATSYEGVLDEIASQIQEGEPPSLESYLNRYPEFADRLQKVVPAMQAMFDLGLNSDASLHGRVGDDPLETQLSKPIDGLLGDFRIIREIGRGGMGIVYEAEQLSLNRQVALKVLPLASTLDEKHLQRFRNEAYAAASLNHPHIVDVYAVGIERGVNYLAMKYVAGQDLARVLSEARRNLQSGSTKPRDNQVGQSESRTTHEFSPPSSRDGDVDGNAETVEAAAAETTEPHPASSLGHSSWKNYIENVVRIFIDAAEALDYAHQQGIVHRDIKPSNLLLDERGRIWIADFGLAQMERATDVTLTGDLLGTLRYMSPEQASGERQIQDHRTDIYSLGITLYEALALEAAFQEVDRVKLIQSVREGNLAPLRSRNQRIPRNLDVIVGKATSREPSQRYATALELAEDLRRFSNGLAIKAKPPNLFQKAFSWSRTHPVVTACVLVLVLSTALFSSVTSALLLRERDKTLEAMQTANSEQQRAEFRARESDAVLSFMLDDLFQSLSPNRRQGVPNIPADQLLARAGRLVDERFADQPRVKASVLHMLGRLNRTFGRLKTSREQLEAAYRLREELLGADDPSTLDTGRALGSLISNFDEYDKATALLSGLLKQHKRILGATHADTLLCELQIASMELNTAQYAEAEKRYRHVMNVADQHLRSDHAATLDAKSGLAMTLRAQDAFDEAEDLLVNVIAILDQSEAWGPSHMATMENKYKLAFCLNSQQKFEEAEQVLRPALETCRKVVGDNHPVTSDVLNLLGITLRQRKKYEEARTFLEASLRIEEQLYGPNHATLAAPLNNLAALYQEMGMRGESIELLERGLGLHEKAFGPEHPDTLSLRHNLARAYLYLPEVEKANAINEEVLEIRRRVLGEEHSQTLKSMNLLAIGYSKLGRHKEALELHLAAYEGRNTIYGPQNADALQSKLDIVEELFHLDRIREANELYRELEQESVAALGAEHPQTIWKMIRFAQLMSDKGFHLVAVLKFRRVVELRLKSLGQHPDTMNAMKDMAIIAGRISQDYGNEVILLLYWTEPSRFQTIPSLLLREAGGVLARVNQYGFTLAAAVE